MSIRDLIAGHDGKELFCLPPLLRSEEMIRALFVTAEIDDVVWPEWSEDRDGYRLSLFREALDTFTKGAMIGVALDPFDKDARAFLARVAPIDARVWDLRAIDPTPGIRCLGFFAERDVFIALSWQYRENLETREDWKSEIQNCVDQWRRLFGNEQPVGGDDLNEYLTANYISV
jgi:hypothetical protein